MGVHEHRKAAAVSLRVGIITLSTTRNLETDESGNWMAARLAEAGHQVVCHTVAADREADISGSLREAVENHAPQVLLMNGGTGIGGTDVTIEAVKPLFRKELTAFGSLFAMLSFEEVGGAAMISRASAGIVGQTVVFCMPGSLKACRLACNRLIFQEMGHLVRHVEKG